MNAAIQADTATSRIKVGTVPFLEIMKKQRRKRKKKRKKKKKKKK